MSEGFWLSHAFGNDEEKKNTTFSKTANMFSHINTVLAFITMGLLLCLPGIRGVKELPFKIHVPFVDIYQYPYYQIALIWQWTTNYWTVLFSIMCYDYIFVMFSVSTICQLQMLQSAIQNVSESGDLTIRNFLAQHADYELHESKNAEARRLALLKVCVKHHSFITE